MQYKITTIEEMIHFIENHELTTNQVNQILSHLKYKCLFIYDYSPMERGKMLREQLSKPEWGLFVDRLDLGVVKDE